MSVRRIDRELRAWLERFRRALRALDFGEAFAAWWAIDGLLDARLAAVGQG